MFFARIHIIHEEKADKVWICILVCKIA